MIYTVCVCLSVSVYFGSGRNWSPCDGSSKLFRRMDGAIDVSTWSGTLTNLAGLGRRERFAAQWLKRSRDPGGRVNLNDQ